MHGEGIRDDMAMKTLKRPARRPVPAAKKVAVQSVTPFLWFNDNAEEAARFYVSLLKGSKIVSADPMSVIFELAGTRFHALNGGPSYKLDPAYSMFVSVKTQAEVDALWTALTEGGEESQCGWLVDRFGVSWQIIPERLPKLLHHKDPKVAKRAMDAMLKMQKIDIAALDAAVKTK